MWSPQQYTADARARGLSDELIDTAIQQIEAVATSDHQLPAILSLNHLAGRSDVDYTRLRQFVNRSDHSAYRKFSIRKRSGGRRFIRVPAPDLMQVQRWINAHVLANVPVHSASHAFRRHHSIKRCAARHCGARWLVKVDIADFFDSISEIQVFRVFCNLGYQRLVAFELARLCTVATSSLSPRISFPHWLVRRPNHVIGEYSQEMLGYLPQGAPTSPMLSNLVMSTADQELERIGRAFGMTYTRYSDDITFSTRSKDFGRTKASDLVGEVYRVLAKRGFLPQYRKTHVISPGSKKIVLGLSVDGDQPRLQRHFKDRLRQHLYYLHKVGPVAHAEKRGFDSVWGLKCHLKGLIDFANMIEPQYARERLAEFSAIEWPC